MVEAKVLNMQRVEPVRIAKRMPYSLHSQQPNHSDRHWYIAQSRDTDDQNLEVFTFLQWHQLRFLYLSICFCDGGLRSPPCLITHNIDRLDSRQKILSNLGGPLWISLAQTQNYDAILTIYYYYPWILWNLDHWHNSLASHPFCGHQRIF